MKQRIVAWGLVLAAAMWLLAPHARATLTFSLTPPAQSGLPGETLSFIGTILNSGAGNVFLNGTSAVAPVVLTLDDGPFFLNVPPFLAPGGSFAGGVFDIGIGANATPATYIGNFAIFGGADTNAFDALASVDFSVTVGGITAVDEPNANVLLATAIVLVLIVLRRRPVSRLRSRTAAAA